MEGLRPLGVGELLDAAFKIYRARFKVMVLAVLVPVLPTLVLAGLLIWSAAPETSVDPETGLTRFEGSLAPFLGAMFLVVILYFLSTTLATAACIRAVSSVYVGDEVTWRESLRFGVKRLPALVGLTILTGLGMALGFVACIIPGIILYVMWSVATPALLVEGVGVTEAMGRSRRLVEGSFWRVLGVLALSSLLTGIAAQAVQLPLQLLGGLAGEAGGVVGSALGQVAALVIVQPFSAALLVALYVDLRVRKEGFDLVLWAQRIGAPLPAGGFPAQPGAPTWAPVAPYPGAGAYPPPGYGQPGYGYPPQPGYPPQAPPPPGYGYPPQPGYPPQAPPSPQPGDSYPPPAPPPPPSAPWSPPEAPPPGG